MKKLFLFVMAMVLLAPIVAKAQSPFDGTWKADLSKVQMPAKPDVYLLQGGIYQCKTCVPPFSVKADGQDHAVTGHPYYDSVSVQVVDDRTIIETDKKDGKVVTTSKVTVAPDGKTATFEFTDTSASNGAPVTGKGEIARVAKGPAGSHATSGSWRTVKFENFSDNGITTTYKVDGDMLNMSSPTGQSYSAKMDGTDAPYKGDPGTTSVSVKRLSRNVIEETDKRDGKVIGVTRITVSPNGKTMTFAITDKLRGTTSRFVADKQ
jgi:hypothetical protein